MSAEPLGSDFDAVLARGDRFLEGGGHEEDATPALGQPEGPAGFPWPELDPAALHGLAREIVEAFEPHTEADPVALLASVLVMFGNVCGRNPHLMVGEDRHGANLFVCLVGETAKARKGTSQAGPRRVIGIADPAWAQNRILGGLGSGEGLITSIRDPTTKQTKSGEAEIVDPGVADKRLMLVEEEMSAIFKIAERHGAIASEALRRAWDSRSVLATITKNNPAIATNPHVSMLGHITKDELRRCMTDTDVANGLANRFAWFVVRRSKPLAMPRRLPDEQANELGNRVRAALEFARTVGECWLDDDAMNMWERVYPELSEGKPGLFGALVARGEAITLRFALDYALLDCLKTIKPVHLEAALALWEYAEASARFLVGTSTGDQNADRIYAFLKSSGEMPKKAIYALFNNNVNRQEVDRSLQVLVQARLAVCRLDNATGGRPAELWQAIG